MPVRSLSVPDSETPSLLTSHSDPWWIFTTVALFYNIKTRYELTMSQIIHTSPRFAIMLVAMLLSIVFLVLDICSVTDALKSANPDGLNPFWKLSFVFKCLTDSVILDDFKTALDRLRAYKIGRLCSFAIDDGGGIARGSGNPENLRGGQVGHANEVLGVPSPDEDYIHQEPDWQEPKVRQHLDAAPPDGSVSHILRPNSDRTPDSAGSEYARALSHVTEGTPHDSQGPMSDKDIGVAR